jgi:hypothetical protein
MLKFIRFAAAAAALSFVPAASLGLASQQAVASNVQAQARPTPAVQKIAPGTEFGLDIAGEAQAASGLAPGQTGAEFRAWLDRSPANRTALASFRDYLAAEGVASVIPVWQLVRTSSSWRECGAQPFEVPPQNKWDGIITTLKFVRDQVEPRVGEVETLSAYRNEQLNACSHGAPQSAHRHFVALDLTPVNKALDRDEMIRSVCTAHARSGDDYDAGLGFYTGRRFHVDSSGYRKWGPNGKGASSPCVGKA